MRNFWICVLTGVLAFCTFELSAQIVRPAAPGQGRQRGKGDVLDSLRKKDEGRGDTIIYTSKYIRFTDLNLLKDSTRTLALDTAAYNLQNYSPIDQPDRPTANLGSIGLPYRDMLFNPASNIGFDPGFHTLDAYLLTEDSIRYYRARSPYTELYYVGGSRTEQLFKVTHSQNIRPNWNVGVNYFRNGSDGFYSNQNVNHLNAAIFTWFESKNKRYNLLANGIFNRLRASENGGPVRGDTIFSSKTTFSHKTEEVRLSGSGPDMPHQTWHQKNFFLKQFYYIGRIDSLNADTTSGSILPTQRVSHAISYNINDYSFFKNEPDPYGAFPFQTRFLRNDYSSLIPSTSADFTHDSTSVRNLRNEFMYSFYLRGRSVKFLKNELKLDLGLQHDLYWYAQMGYKSSFQDITLRASPGYRFSDRVNVEGDLRQIVQGRDAGDYFYEAHSNILLSKSAGRIVLGAYAQNKSPEQIYERLNYQYYKWQMNFDRTKINNLNFSYINSKLRLQATANYYLLSNYHYLQESQALPQFIMPMESGNISLLKLNLRKDLRFGKFTLENHLFYQKTDAADVLRIPEFYSYHSFYFSNRYFKVLLADLGFDVRYHTPYKAPSYAVDINQFYNGRAIEYANVPVADLWLRATLKRANLFVKYGYANQGLINKGYFTVNGYPMPDALLRFGVSWNFYD